MRFQPERTGGNPFNRFHCVDDFQDRQFRRRLDQHHAAADPALAADDRIASQILQHLRQIGLGDLCRLGNLVGGACVWRLVG